ncbi:MAG: hypothetical protein ACYTEQ_28770 [Planctomycetota bacterium]|jgi:hypothetical protein
MMNGRQVNFYLNQGDKHLDAKLRTLKQSGNSITGWIKEACYEKMQSEVDNGSTERELRNIKRTLEQLLA